MVVVIVAAAAAVVVVYVSSFPPLKIIFYVSSFLQDGYVLSGTNVFPIKAGNETCLLHSLCKLLHAQASWHLSAGRGYLYSYTFSY